MFFLTSWDHQDDQGPSKWERGGYDQRKSNELNQQERSWSQVGRKLNGHRIAESTTGLFLDIYIYIHILHLFKKSLGCRCVSQVRSKSANGPRRDHTGCFLWPNPGGPCGGYRPGEARSWLALPNGRRKCLLAAGVWWQTVPFLKWHFFVGFRALWKIGRWRARQKGRWASRKKKSEKWPYWG